MSDNESPDMDKIHTELNETKVRLMKAEEEIVKLKAELLEKEKQYIRALQIGAALVLRTSILDEEV